jgi:putative membrane protein
MNLKTVYVFTGLMVFVLVAVTYFSPDIRISNPERFYFLPKLNAVINGLSALSLSAAIIFIKSKKIKWHVVFVSISLVLTLVFLVSYLLYHAITPPTKFSGEGIIKWIYYLILISHIALAAITVPLVLTVLTFAIQKNYDKHRKMAKYAFPVWLYVSITGVLVYLFNAPYYN